MNKPLRILYASGPGDVIGTYKHWVNGQEDPSQVSVTYSSQFYDVCRDLNAQAYVISSYQNKQFLHDGQFTIEHRPIPLCKASGILYHLGQLWYEWRLLVDAVYFRANVAIVVDGIAHWFILSLLTWFGVQVIPSLHCTLWCQYLPQRRVEKLLSRLNRNFFASHCTAILTVSNAISEQVAQVANGQPRPIVNFFPLYRRTEFTGIQKPDQRQKPFRVLFVGRIESDKGVFHLLEIAKRFAAQKLEDITFDVCGSGSALESLRQAATLAGIGASFTCHGYCNKQQMHEMFTQAHVVIVPTTKFFTEGFNKVVAEGILSGRPVVTSAVCPALSYLHEAVVEVLPDDLIGYGDALLKLRDDHKFYEQKKQSCLGLQEQFYNTSNSWGAMLKSIIVAIQQSQAPKYRLTQSLSAIAHNSLS